MAGAQDAGEPRDPPDGAEMARPRLRGEEDETLLAHWPAAVLPKVRASRQKCFYIEITLDGFFFHRSVRLFATSCKLSAATACSEEQLQTITRSSTAASHEQALPLPRSQDGSSVQSDPEQPFPFPTPLSR